MWSPTSRSLGVAKPFAHQDLVGPFRIRHAALDHPGQTDVGPPGTVERGNHPDAFERSGETFRGCSRLGNQRDAGDQLRSRRTPGKRANAS